MCPAGVLKPPSSVRISDVNEAPSVSLTNLVPSLAEDTDTTGTVRVADIVVTDDALGSETLGLTGDDAALFEILGFELFLQAFKPSRPHLVQLDGGIPQSLPA